MIDGSYVRAHQHSQNAAKGSATAIGRSAGGPTSKMHFIADSHGNPIDFQVTAGNVHDVAAAPDLISNIPEAAENLLADKGYDSDPLRDQIRLQNMRPIIPRRENSSKENPECDKGIYKHRHLVENLFCKIKSYRAVATRYDKLASSFDSTICLACIIIWIKL
jgi:transposase